MPLDVFVEAYETKEKLRFSVKDIRKIFKMHMAAHTPLWTLYRLMMLCGFLFVLIFSGFYWYQKQMTALFISLSLSVAAIPLMIVCHELLHGLAYLLLGAKEIKIGGSLKKFVFYTVADRFVLDAKRFYLVALFPLGVIGLFLYGAMKLWPSQILFFSFLFFFHLLSCSGDVYLVNYFFAERKKGLFMYDEVDKEETVILEARPKEIPKND